MSQHRVTSHWNLPASPGFQGLRDDLPLRVYYRHLPHWRQAGATYFVTFRLADSLPRAKLQELAFHREEWKGRVRRPTAEQWDAYSREAMQKVEVWLDQGAGSCLLRDPKVQEIVTEVLCHDDGQRYELDAFVVMPNHIHLLIRPFNDDQHALEKLLQNRKSRLAKEVNALLGKTKQLWQEESFDRIVRDEEHLYRCLQYIGDNPRRARLRSGFLRWVRPEWEQLGWRFAKP